ncbi:MAG: glutamyl-tRNA reductase [Pseudomonadota bacterium]
MTINIIGINHNTAPVEVREQIVIAESALPQTLRDIRELPGITETIVLSTCNRTEIYWAGNEEPAELIADLLEKSEHTGSGFRNSLFSRSDKHAAEHLFRVACGLDSMVLGETQITGQLKNAYRLAQQNGAVGAHLGRVFEQAFSIAKKVRTDTNIGASPVSVAYAAVRLARQLFAGFENHSALLVGAGETIELVARHLRTHGIRKIYIANRSESRAQKLANEFDGFAMPLTRLPQALPDADILISSTGSPDPVITHEMMAAAINSRRRKPLFAVDIAVPRDIESACGKLSDVYLYTIDDLNNVITDGQETRRQASLEADKIIRTELENFHKAERQRIATPTILSVRESVMRVRDEALEAGIRRVAAGHPVEDVMKQMVHTLTQRILHQPTERLREAAAESDEQFFEIARELFLGRKPAEQDSQDEPTQAETNQVNARR